jgi:phytoene dehydrogenase-like protein
VATYTVDAVIIGAGISGIAAAARLAKAGWSVALLDEHERIGGFVQASECTVPGYVHDTFSSWHPLFVTGPVYAEFGPTCTGTALSTPIPTGPSPMASGRPLSPSQATMHTSATPRLRSSASTVIQCFAPSPPVPTQSPSTSRSPSQLIPSTT